jgi:hypothetical protein
MMLARLEFARPLIFALTVPAAPPQSPSLSMEVCATCHRKSMNLRQDGYGALHLSAAAGEYDRRLSGEQPLISQSVRYVVRDERARRQVLPTPLSNLV